MNVTPNLVLFGIAALLSCAAAVGVVFSRDAVRAALCLVVNFFILAFLYFTLNAEMLGITQVVVYAGAIMVLFLFVIMLLNLVAPNLIKERKDLKIGLGTLLGFGLFCLTAVAVLGPLRGIDQVQAPDTFGSPQEVGLALFTQYTWPFEIASVLLLVGIVGSILLAKRKI